MIPKNILSTTVSLGLIALLLTAILWYMPSWGSDFWGQFLDNWVTLIAFFLAAYWAIIIKRRTPL